MAIVVLVVSMLALSYVLSKATDMLVRGISQLGNHSSVGTGGLTLIFVAVATSLPELFVSVMGALQGANRLPLGIVLGSNIANISLVVGMAALVSGTVKARDSVYKKDILYAILIGCLPLILLLDGVLSRADGGVLLLVYVAFSVVSLNKKKKKQLSQVEYEYYENPGLVHRILTYVGRKDVEQGMGRLVVGSSLLIVCAELIVRLANYIANVMDVPLMLVGLFMVSVGACLPELAFGIKTVRKKEYVMTFSNIIGSVVVNSSLILGLVALLAPIKLEPGNSKVYYISVIAFIVISGMFWLMTYSKKQIERWEGAVLLAFYFVFVLVQMRFS